jgi:hypothetical protein
MLTTVLTPEQNEMEIELTYVKINIPWSAEKFKKITHILG